MQSVAATAAWIIAEPPDGQNAQWLPEYAGKNFILGPFASMEYELEYQYRSTSIGAHHQANQYPS